LFKWFKDFLREKDLDIETQPIDFEYFLILLWIFLGEFLDMKPLQTNGQVNIEIKLPKSTTKIGLLKLFICVDKGDNLNDKLYVGCGQL